MAVGVCAVTADKGQPAASTAAVRPEANRIMLAPEHVKSKAPRGRSTPRVCAIYLWVFGRANLLLGLLDLDLGQGHFLLLGSDRGHGDRVLDRTGLDRGS